MAHLPTSAYITIASMTESKIQSKIITIAESLGWYTVKVTLCNKSGFPDLIMFRDGRTICMEVKSPGKDARPLQEEQQKRIRAKGVPVYVVSDIATAEAILSV